MKEYIFIEGDLPKGFTLTYEEPLFNTKAHRTIQSKENWISFYVLNNKEQKVDASFHVCINFLSAKSPYRAPFGSIDFSKSIGVKTLSDFIQFVESALREKGIKKLEVKMPPTGYESSSTSLLQVVLLNSQFQVKEAEVGSLIKINECSFDKCLEDSERYVLNKCKKSNFICQQLSVDKLDEVYEFIDTHLSSKGYKLSMSLPDLQETVNVFRDNFFLFVVVEGDKVVAASISILVTKKILYNFYVAHDVEYNQFSPVVMIIEGLYDFCKAKNLQILDLGTSMLNGGLNVPLLNFKLRLGAEVTGKLTFIKELS